MKYSQLTQHDETSKHHENFERFKQNPGNSQQLFLSTSSDVAENIDPFFEELCDALIGANIPLNKLNNESLKSFLSKHCNQCIPGESKLRKRYLEISYNKVFF